MIWVKMRLQSADRKPKPIYLRGVNWSDIMSQLAHRRTINRQPVWHHINMETISEAEYNRATHPELPGMSRR